MVLPPQPPERAAPISVTVLTGYLGAGKTTLLNRILSADHGLRVGVLVNDFGAVNIDTKLVVDVEGETVSLANGCVCCTVRDDLVTETTRLLSRPDPPDHVVIETSGVSDPRVVMQTFIDSELEAIAWVDSVIAVVDTEQLLEMRVEEQAHALDQVSAADLVILNKTDLATSARVDTVRALLTDHVPDVRLLQAVHARVPLGLLLGVGSFTADRHRAAGAVMTRGSTADEEQGHAVPKGHDALYSTFHWSSERPVSLAAFRSVVGDLPTWIYRAKGLVQLQEYPRYSVEFQLAGRRSSLRATGLWRETSPRSDLVMIASGAECNFEDLVDRLTACTADHRSGVASVDWRANPRVHTERSDGIH